ncbi:MAG: type I DNA topoisomerase [Marinilabiliales bacterium]
MISNLVIVESPAKAKTIEKILGKDYKVVSSYGHIRDLAKKDNGVNINDNYKPNYIIPADKKKVVSELKKLVKDAEYIWLASDEDREGEAIAWHLSEVLKLNPDKTKRIVFHEITNEAIKNAIENFRQINLHLVNAQQARRILDRLVGFEMSPVLWKKVKHGLSAGRVQSVAVRLIVERENEINNFKPSISYKIHAIFTSPKGEEFKAELSKTFNNKNKALEFLKECINSDFIVSEIVKKPGKKSPPPPFTTSTLQQEANRKFGFSVARTMSIAQKLYETGLITYMRTDSLNLSNLAINTSKKIITQLFGEKFSKPRKYKTKTKGAQEAHEAIRPTYIDKQSINASNDEKRLYELIWKRTLASQMSDAAIEKTQIKIDISNSEYQFIAHGEVITFEGFLKLYSESTDDETPASEKGLLPKINKNEQLSYKSIQAIEKHTTHPPRYSEASLVRKLEELGIGRPSTYAPTIATIQNRGYVVKEDRQGFERNIHIITLKNGKISETSKSEKYGMEKAKLFPTDIGIVVTDFLLKHFSEILDYGFTASIEEDFDKIAAGKKEWVKMVDEFYKPFHTTIEKTLNSAKNGKGEKLLGIDPESGKNVYAKIGRFGPMIQIGEQDDKEKPKFAALLKSQSIQTITLDEALDLFKLPRIVGKWNDKEVIAAIGRFGPYLKYDGKFYSLGKTDPLTVQIDEAIRIINEQLEKNNKKIIKEFKEKNIQVLNGRYGPYISQNKKNYRIPKKINPESITLDECLNIIEKALNKKNKQQ